MTESIAHVTLVDLIKMYVTANYAGVDPSLFAIDNGEPNCAPTPMGDGYRPDFMYEWNGLLIIGEAKTPFDLERPHSVSQYRSYLRYCERFHGEAHLVLSTAWDCEAAAKNMLNRLYREVRASKTKTHVISKLTFLGVPSAAH